MKEQPSHLELMNQRLKGSMELLAKKIVILILEYPEKMAGDKADLHMSELKALIRKCRTFFDEVQDDIEVDKREAEAEEEGRKWVQNLPGDVLARYEMMGYNLSAK